ncbi:MAG: proline--tRNA ligase [Candidatus Aenigmatarchaeota archaeon]
MLRNEKKHEDMEAPEALTTKKDDNFSEWFHQVIKVADIIDQRFPVQGFLTYKPYGYSIHSNYIGILEEFLNKTGHKKCYFPIVIPERLLGKEAKHIESFNAEVFWITQGGETKFAEKLALRPTSETVMYDMLSLWIRSWRDLPLKLYQSTTVYRYETKHTRPLIRDREIHWNEAHTSHATAEEAAEQIKTGMNAYSEVFKATCVPTLFLVAADVFPGAVSAIEPYTLFPDGRALEMGSVNNLGQRFSKAFGVKFRKEDDTEDFVYQTCYGISERVLAAMVALHGDNKGLVLPPRVAPIQAVVVPIVFEKEKKKILACAKKIADELGSEIRVHFDDREISAGAKFYDWELRGVPIRIEIGPKDIEKDSVMLVRRDTGEKKSVKQKDLIKTMFGLLDDIQDNIYRKALAWHDSKIKIAKHVNDIIENVNARMLSRVFWCGNVECAADMEKKTDAVFLGYAEGDKPKGSEDCMCGNKAKHVGYIGKTY